MAFLENYPEQNKENVSETSSEYYVGQSFAILTKTHQCVERESKGGVEGQRGLAKGEVVGDLYSGCLLSASCTPFCKLLNNFLLPWSGGHEV